MVCEYVAEAIRLGCSLIAEHRTAVRLNPDLAEAHYSLGTTLADQGKPEEAIAEKRAAIRIKPHYAEAHHGLGISLADQGKLDEAIVEYRAAIRLKPDLTEPHYSLGVALGKQGKLDAAIAEYRTAVRLKPDYADAHYGLGVTLADQGERQEALAELRKARDKAERGSELAQSIEKALTELDHQADRRDRRRLRSPVNAVRPATPKKGKAITDRDRATCLGPPHNHRSGETALSSTGFGAANPDGDPSTFRRTNVGAPPAERLGSSSVQLVDVLAGAPGIADQRPRPKIHDKILVLQWKLTTLAEQRGWTWNPVGKRLYFRITLGSMPCTQQICVR